MSEVRTLALDLAEGATAAYSELRAVLKKGAGNIKDQLVAEARGSYWFSFGNKFPSSIDYDIIEGGSTVTAEIGPNKSRRSAASLGNIAYFGTSRGGGTVPDPQGALDAEAPNIVEWLGKVGAEVIAR